VGEEEEAADFEKGEAFADVIPPRPCSVSSFFAVHPSQRTPSLALKAK